MHINRPGCFLHNPSDEGALRVSWEETPCLLCGLDKYETVLEASDPLPAAGSGLVFAVVRCKSCGLCYSNPRPTEREMEQFYPSEYQPHRRASKLRQSRRIRPFWSRLFGRPCGERRGVLPWPGPGRLLDFGCGAGNFLKTMANQGWQVTGLDAAVGAVQLVREQHGLRALVGTLPHPELRPGSFDVITMWHSLEHVHHPLAILREAFRLLIPGGKLIVATPNIDSLPFRMFGRSWFGLDLPRHLVHFTPTTLTAMLETVGFKPDPVRQMRHNDWLRSSARLALRHGTARLRARALLWKPLAKFAAWYCYATGQSDCMMCVAQRPN